MKYIIFDNGEFVIFPETMNHGAVARSLRATKDSVLGAGFVRIGCEIEESEHFANCYGESISLGIRSRGDEDGAIIERYLNAL